MVLQALSIQGTGLLDLRGELTKWFVPLEDTSDRPSKENEQDTTQSSPAISSFWYDC